MERLFQILAVVLAGVAAYFFWRGDGDTAFVTLVLGCVSFFLGLRFQIKERNTKRGVGSEKENAEIDPSD
jgi:uncharacterized membrane protein